jgi:hypothetical protein
MKIQMTMVYFKISQHVWRDWGIPKDQVTWPRHELHISEIQTQIFNSFVMSLTRFPLCRTEISRPSSGLSLLIRSSAFANVVVSRWNTFTFTQIPWFHYWRWRLGDTKKYWEHAWRHSMNIELWFCTSSSKQYTKVTWGGSMMQVLCKWIIFQLFFDITNTCYKEHY